MDLLSILHLLNSGPILLQGPEGTSGCGEKTLKTFSGAFPDALTAVARNSLFPQITGLECPNPGTVVFHFIFH